MAITEDTVTQKLIEVLRGIQSDSGFEDGVVTGSTCPLRDLEGFDSLVWPYSIGELADELGEEIPNDVNIFVSKDGRRKLTVEETARAVCERLNVGRAKK